MVAFRRLTPVYFDLRRGNAVNTPSTLKCAKMIVGDWRSVDLSVGIAGWCRRLRSRHRGRNSQRWRSGWRGRRRRRRRRVGLGLGHRRDWRERGPWCRSGRGRRQLGRRRHAGGSVHSWPNADPGALRQVWKCRHDLFFGRAVADPRVSEPGRVQSGPRGERGLWQRLRRAYSNVRQHLQLGHVVHVYSRRGLYPGAGGQSALRQLRQPDAHLQERLHLGSTQRVRR